MARIRTIKPDFFRHEGLFEAEQESGLPLRVAFIGIWTVADRDGRFPWKPRALKLDALPFDVIDFGHVMDALEGAGFILKYEHDGKAFGWIPSWSKHQVINSREAKSVIPEPPSGIERMHMHAHARTGKEEHVPRGVNIAVPLRETVFARDGRACVRCHSMDDLTIDHIFPQCMGGTHAITNLRTLCRSCNSARPVQGQALIDDLAMDGLTIGDMQRMCMHVQDQGEGKGREGKGKEGEGKGKDACAELFGRFWSLYPNRKGKADAEKAWSKLKPTDELFAQICEGLARQVTCHDWTKDGGKFIPHPATWLNGKRWTDEVKLETKPLSVHSGFDDRDYNDGLITREDGSLGL